VGEGVITNAKGGKKGSTTQPLLGLGSLGLLCGTLSLLLLGCGVGLARGSRGLCLGRGPEGLQCDVRDKLGLNNLSGRYTDQVVTEKLHDECGVLVALLAEGIELWKDGWLALNM